MYSKSFSYVQAALCKPSCYSKDFIHRCLHKWFCHLQLFCSSVYLIPVAGLRAHRCGSSSCVMWPKSSVSRRYKNCHMLPKCSCLMFYISIYQMGIKWEVPSKTVVFTLGPYRVMLITSFSFGNFTTHTRSILVGLQWQYHDTVLSVRRYSITFNDYLVII